MTVLVLVATAALAKRPPKPPPEPDKATRWVTGSEEFYGLALQTFAMAEGVLLAKTAFLPATARWAVVMDLDETLLDNAQYQVENPAYSDATWGAWEERREALPTPGGLAFVDAVHHAGGHVAFVTNRQNDAATRDVVVKLGLLGDGDVLCVTAKDADGHWISEKRTRREQVRTGEGACSLGGPALILGYFGDQRGDFPDADEETADPTGASLWGSRYFVLPNPMYGSWIKASNRTVPR